MFSFPGQGLRDILSGLFCLWAYRDVDRLALPLLSWRKPQSATQAAVSPPLLPICGQRSQQMGTVLHTKAGQTATPFLFPVFSQGINVPGKGITVPPLGVSSFMTAT